MERVERRELRLALLPWVLFAVVARNVGQGTAWAAFAALVTVLVVTFPSRETVKRFEVASIVLFSTLLVAGVFAGGNRGAFVNEYGRALAFGGLALITVASLFIEPFTAEYARDNIRKRYWQTAGFQHVNFAMSAVSAGAFTAITASFVAGQIHTSTLANTIFHWLVPIALFFVAAKIAGRWWHDYLDNHVSAADETRDQIAVLDTLFLGRDPERRVS